MFLKGKKLKKFYPPVSGKEIGFWTKLMYLHFLYNIFIILAGGGFIFWGSWMIVKGVKGEIDWIINLFGNKSSLYNATPGVLLIIVALILILFARSKVEYKKK